MVWIKMNGNICPLSISFTNLDFGHHNGGHFRFWHSPLIALSQRKSVCKKNRKQDKGKQSWTVFSEHFLRHLPVYGPVKRVHKSPTIEADHFVRHFLCFSNRRKSHLAEVICAEDRQNRKYLLQSKFFVSCNLFSPLLWQISFHAGFNGNARFLLFHLFSFAFPAHSLLLQCPVIRLRFTWRCPCTFC